MMRMKKLVMDESGIALPLAIIVMVLVGVMGAGLLVFVRNDLQAVIEVNRGQKALEIAEAGIAAAKQQQLSDVVRRHYDRNKTNDCFNGQIRATSEDWSPNTDVYSNPSDCGSVATTKARAGVTRNFAGGAFNVTIECFNQLNDDTTNDPCAGASIENAPESIEASKRAYFKITSTGYFPADGSGAVRTVRAIVHTNRLDVPTAYYTPNDIEFNGGPTVRGVSFFARGNIYLGNNTTVVRSDSALYKDWDTTNATNFTPPSNLNTVPRRAGPLETDTKLEGAGLAAEGKVCQARNQCSQPSDSRALGDYDYDSTTGTKGSLKRFVRKSDADIASNVANASGTISYPFNPNARFDLVSLESIARDQGNYYDATSSTVDIVNQDNNPVPDPANLEYPRASSDQTVFYVKANGKTINYKVNYSGAVSPLPTQAKGLIIIENGNLDISNNSNGFDGVIIVTGTPPNNSFDCAGNNTGATGCYKNSGNRTVRGFVISDNTMIIGGGVDPFSVVGDYTQRPGFYNMKQWSWRECYSVTCS